LKGYPLWQTKSFIRRIHMKKMYCITLALGLFILLATPLAFAQDLDGKWFEVKLAQKGYIRDKLTEAVGDKVSGKYVSYVQFVYNTAGTYPFYEMHVYYPRDPGWNFYFESTDLNRSLIYGGPDQNLTFLDKQFVTWGGTDKQWWYFENGDVFAYVNAMVIINVKRKAGVVSGATLTSEGCISQVGLKTHDYVGGSCTIKGKLIKSEILPDGIDPAGFGPQWVP
jgi:hypothetical protein